MKIEEKEKAINFLKENNKVKSLNHIKKRRKDEKGNA